MISFFLDGSNFQVIVLCSSSQISSLGLSLMFQIQSDERLFILIRVCVHVYYHYLKQNSEKNGNTSTNQNPSIDEKALQLTRPLTHSERVSVCVNNNSFRSISYQ